jgi:hypothetical protein
VVVSAMAGLPVCLAVAIGEQKTRDRTRQCAASGSEKARQNAASPFSAAASSSSVRKAVGGPP